MHCWVSSSETEVQDSLTTQVDINYNAFKAVARLSLSLERH